MKYIMSLDQGTTSSRCVLFDVNGTMCAVSQQEFDQIYPEPGWVEHDASQIWAVTLKVAQDAMEKCHAQYSDIAAIGITNQRETTVVWDKATGKPIANAIVWQCRRTSDIIDELVNAGYSEMITEKTGLIPDAYYSGSKIKWLLDNTPGAREKAECGELLFGTIETWLIWNLTGGKVHVTDYTNASRTMLFNIHELKWDEELLRLLDVPASLLPEVRPSSCIYGDTDDTLFGGPIPIAGAAGDQQCALFGQCCFKPGDMKNTYGTGCFMLLNTGLKAVRSRNGLITTIAASADDRIHYALEGSIFIAGAAIQWLRDEMKLISSSAESETVATSVPDSAGAYVVPAFTGLGAPHWKQDARGIVVGITRGFGSAHLVRATLESLAYQTCDIAYAMEQDSGIKITSLKVDGGASSNNFLMQLVADVMPCEVVRPTCIETTALGSAFLAGLAVGYWKDLDDIRQHWAIDRTFTPEMEEEKRQTLLSGWERAMKTAIFWADNP